MAVLGTAGAYLYDLTEDPGDFEEGPLVDTARSRYQKVVSDLREQILGGTPAPGSTLDGQAKIAREARTDSALINRALAALSAEGLVRVEHGKRTLVLARSLWLVEFRCPAGAGDTAGASLQSVTAAHPAVRVLRSSEDDGGGRLVELTIESADLAGAVTVAIAVARQALGSLPIAAMSAREA